MSIVSAIVLSAICAMPVSAERPNVLFIAADDLRCDLGCYGHPLAKTPHLDRLAARGVLFEHAYCQQALCNPSRASLLTGLTPDTLQIWNLPRHFREHDAQLVTLPQYFRNHGYFTQNIGKVFHNWRQEIQGNPASWSVPAVMHFARHDDDQPLHSGPLPPNTATARRSEARELPDSAYFDGRIAQLSVDALKELSGKQQPFFLAVGFWKPHLPFNAPRKYWDLYDRDEIRPASNPLPPQNGPSIALHDSREMRGRPGPPDEQESRELIHGYLAAISYLDAQVGRVMTALSDEGLGENTIVVFWSDHGFHLGEHGLWCKTSNFEHDAHVPLVIAGPGAQRGTRVQNPVELLDLYPTLVELCGLPGRSGLEGTSLVPSLRDPKAAVKTAAWTQHPRPAYYKGSPEVMGVSVRTPRYRYTEWRRFGTTDIVARELYDHDNDPDENVNCIEAPPDPELYRRAVELLHQRFPRQAAPGR